MTRTSWADTEPLGQSSHPGRADEAARGAPRLLVRVLSGPDAGLVRESDGAELAIGSAAGNELELSDRAVSSHHCAIRVRCGLVELVDLGSTNGVWVAGVRVAEAYPDSGAVIRIGSSRLRLEILPGPAAPPPHAGGSDLRLGPLVGASPPTRQLLARLRALAATESPVLLFGPPGTGKSLAARAIHLASDRAAGPLVTVDRGGYPAEPLDPSRIEAAAGGTLVIEELGELDPGGQERLLALMETPGSPRVVATSRRDVRIDVNRGRLRAELYRRLHHARARIPPLAERPEDVAILAAAFHRELAGADAGDPPAELVAHLERQARSITVREIRSAVARALLATPSGSSAG